jgi:hypothetical protein
MVKRRKSANAILASLNIEMRQPHITASALAAMHKRLHKLVFIDSFHGHACSKCAGSRRPNRVYRGVPLLPKDAGCI